MGASAPGLRGPHEAGLPLRRRFGLPDFELWLKNAWCVTSMAGRGDVVVFVPISAALSSGSTTGRHDSLVLAQARVEGRAHGAGLALEIRDQPVPLVPFPEELVGDVERGEDRDLGGGP